MLKRFNKIRIRDSDSESRNNQNQKPNAQEEIMNLDAADGTLAGEIILAPLERQRALSKDDEVTSSAVFEFDGEEVKK